jgi:O-antigen ligase
VTLLRTALHRAGSQRLAGVAFGLGVALAYWAWNTSGHVVTVVVALCLLPVAASIVLYPIVGAMLAAVLIAALPATMKPVVPMAVLLATFIGMFIRKVFEGDLRWRVTPFFVWSSLLLIWLVVSAAWASSYDYVGFANRSLGFLIVPVYLEVVRTRADLRRVGIAAALGMIVTGAVMAYGFYELVASGALAKISGAATELKNARFFGFWNSPNALAYSMMAFVAFALALAATGVTKALRRLLLLAAGVGLIVIVLTLSRGAWLCTLVMLLFVLRYHRRRWLALCGVALLVVAASLFLPVNVLDRVQTLAQGRKDASFGERGILLRGGIQMIEDSFPFGWGAGATFRYSPDYSVHRLSPIGTHNSYVDVVAEGGLVGGILLVGMIASLITAVRRSRLQSSSTNEETARGILLGGLIATLTGMAFENVIGFPTYWLFFTIVSLFPVLSSQAHHSMSGLKPSATEGLAGLQKG